jgi:ferredoxin
MSYLQMQETEIQAKLRQEAKSLLEESRVNWLIGFSNGSLKFTTTPLITKNKDEAELLVFNSFITNNLANFLIDFEGRVGIVAKGCDSRSIVSLIQDNKVKRDQLVILGIPCHGLIDLSKVEQITGRERDEIMDICRDSRVSINDGDNSKKLNNADVLYDSCLACELPTPKECDILLGKSSQPTSQKARSEQKLKELQSMPPQERWNFWEKEFDRCIKCYACRCVCPACYCKRCFVEETEPQWLMPVPRWQENLMFQVIRNIHVAGRCTDCGECQRACPVDIPLRGLTRDMYDIVTELFCFKSGMDTAEAPLMTAYEAEEAQDLMG